MGAGDVTRGHGTRARAAGNMRSMKQRRWNVPLAVAIGCLVLAAPRARGQDQLEDRLYQEPLFEFTRVADGVYMAFARPRNPLNCNAAVVINEDDVLVFDALTSPRSARALLKQVRAFTRLPVRWVVDSHFHTDHARGNPAFREAWKGVQIVATTATRDNLATIETERLRHNVEKEQPKEIAKLREEYARTRTPAAKRRLENAEAYLAELKKMEIELPSVTFDRSMTIHKKARDIVLLFLGRAHTSGDAIMYLPREKVVATGDFVTSWGLGLGGDGFANEWGAAMAELAKLDFDKVIPGHGGLTDRKVVIAARDYLAELLPAVRAAYARGAALEDTQRALTEQLEARYAPAFEAGRFAGAVAGHVATIWKDLTARKY